MNKNIKTFTTLTAIAALSFSFYTSTKAPEIMQQKSDIYSFNLKTIGGESTTLAKYKGKKMLLVNVASECGYTPQYKSLEELYKKYSAKLVVIGFPANNFGGQEPGSNTDIKSFCEKNYGVTFPMMEKISVKGADQHPLYKWLGDKNENGVCDESPKWNFSKYLIDENGKILKFFPSSVDPLSADITSLL